MLVFIWFMIWVAVSFVIFLICANNQCDHDYELTDKIRIFDPMFSDQLPAGFERVYICKKCKKKKIVRY